MIRTIKKTKLSDSVTSHRVKIGPEKLNDNDTLDARYRSHLDQLRGKNPANSQPKAVSPQSVAVATDRS